MRSIFTALAFIAVALSPTLHAQSKAQAPFKFTKVDLKLLEQCEALDREFESRALVYHDHAIERRLSEIAAPLLPSQPLENVRWKIRILRDPSVNAAALPNGTIYIFSGLLARAENDDELAGVIAHEATHVANRHSYLFNRSLRKKTVAAEIMSAAVSWSPVGAWGAAAATVAGNMGEIAIAMTAFGYSRQLEEEADRNGLDRVRQSGRDPAQIIRLFTLMDRPLEPTPVPFIFRDHPRIKDRIAYLKQLLAINQDVAPGADPGYVDRMRPVIMQALQLDLDSRRFRSAVAAAERLVAAHPEDPVALYWLGESYRALGPRQTHMTAAELTDAGQRIAYREMLQRTEQQEEVALADTPAGKAALLENRRKAEQMFQKASSIDPSEPEPYLGLGTLYGQEGKTSDAIACYRKYVDLVGKPSEKVRIERRIEELSAQRQDAQKETPK